MGGLGARLQWLFIIFGSGSGSLDLDLLQLFTEYVFFFYRDSAYTISAGLKLPSGGLKGDTMVTGSRIII